MLDATEPSESDDVDDFMHLPDLVDDIEMDVFSSSSLYDMEDNFTPFSYNEDDLSNSSSMGDIEDSFCDNVCPEASNMYAAYPDDSNDHSSVEKKDYIENNSSMQIMSPKTPQTVQKRKASGTHTQNEEIYKNTASNMQIFNASDLKPLFKSECEFKRSIRCKIENNNEMVSPPKKKVKTCRSINSKYRDGYELDKEINISEEEIEKYNQLENFKIECEYCNKVVSISKIFKVSSGRMCCDKCAKERKMKLTELKNDLFEEFDYNDEKLYRCCRLDHSRPLCHFIKYSKRTDSYRLVTNCCYCRLYKSQENELKKKFEKTF